MINLLPERYINEEKNKKYRAYMGLLLAIELGVTGIIGGYPAIQLMEKSQYLEEINSKLQDPRFDEVKATQMNLEEERKNYDTWCGYLKEMKTDSFIGGNVLDTLLGNIPVGVSIDFLKIQEEQRRIVIQGKTKNTFAVMGYISKLQNIYEEAEVTFNLGETQEDGKYSFFDLTMQWQGMEAQDDE